MTGTLEWLVEGEQGLVWGLLALAAFYFWSTSSYGFWAGLGVPYVRPVPLFGNDLRALLQLRTPVQLQQEMYNSFRDAPLVGTYTFKTPRLMVRDPGLIEQVMVKDFSTFMDRGAEVDPESDGLNAHLVVLTGQRWRSLRNKLAPVFTSGKMKGMMDQLSSCTHRLVDHLRQQIRQGGPLEAKYQMAGYTLDVIGSCGFGLEFKAIDDPNSTFREIGERVFSPSKMMVVRRWLRENYPKMARFIQRTRMDTEGYITALVKNTIRHREENSIQRQDFIQLLAELRRQEGANPPADGQVLMTDKVMASNAFVFLLAGYETTASTLAFMLYELAVNPEVQDRLYREVTKVLRKHGDRLDWDTLKDMDYLEQVTSETLRKYPPAGELRRRALKPYRFPKSGLEIPAGTAIRIPVYSLHHDPAYFPEPDKFIPERFSEANRHNLVKFTYLPFGDGPRVCIGMRFALMEIKMAVTALVREFTVKLNPRTISPLAPDPGTLLLAAVGGIWLDFALRQKEQSAP